MGLHDHAVGQPGALVNRNRCLEGFSLQRGKPEGRARAVMLQDEPHPAMTQSAMSIVEEGLGAFGGMRRTHNYTIAQIRAPARFPAVRVTDGRLGRGIKPDCMNALDVLTACRGTWQGTSTLHDPNTKAPEDSSSRVTITPVLLGRFVRLDYSWRYQGTPQEGSLLIGFESDTETVTACWSDTWHMGDKVMVCQGPKPSGRTLCVRGSYSAPPGPDWGWRIEITPEPAGALRVVMFNIWPDGVREDVAVEASYTRTG
jgi:hypothetical protein